MTDLAQDVKDARTIRTRILECSVSTAFLFTANLTFCEGFEQASQPTLTDIERRNLLSFCVVGGGPTGVEYAGELHDLCA